MVPAALCIAAIGAPNDDIDGMDTAGIASPLSKSDFFPPGLFSPASGPRTSPAPDDRGGSRNRQSPPDPPTRSLPTQSSRRARRDVRAPPSPVERRRFPRRVSSRVRDALESDDDDAWRFE